MTARSVVALAAVCLVAGGAAGYALHGSPTPAPSVRAADHVVAVEAQHAAAQETVYVHDSARYAVVHTHWETTRVRDTVVVNQVVYVPRDSADKTIAACSLAFRSCAATVDSLHQLQAANQVAREARDAAQPSRLHTVLNDAGWAAVGWGACRAGVGAHLSLRVPF